MKKEKTKILKEKYAGSFEGKGDKKKPDQANLFGDQDFVYNVLQTDLTDIDSHIESAQKAIEKKKSLIEELRERKQEVEKAVAIVEKQKKESKKKSKEEEKDKE